MRDVEVVLLDIGGVLTCDPWETLVLTPDVGLADRLDKDADTINTIGKSLWNDYSLRQSSETDYWAEYSKKLSVAIPNDLILEIESTVLRALSNASEWLQRVTAHQPPLRVGLISDNTTFWYRKQVKLLELNLYPIENELVFLSFDRGISKADNPGLFEAAAKIVNPNRTVIVDDRAVNRSRAAANGFAAIEKLDELAGFLGMCS